jgi:hypothetical protein
MDIRTVTLEFLRAGPRHNQLISPLTQYLAVCGDAPAGAVYLPYPDHASFERSREELRYAVSSESDSESDRLRGILSETGDKIAQILGSVPGLPGVIASRNATSEILHLRLVLSASELALLPFELSKIPIGGGAPADNWLLLQANAPVCLTRHNRAVKSEEVQWPTRPRILFIYGEDVPSDAHETALVDVLKPWTGNDKPDENWIKVVRNTTLDEIKAAARSGDFTHVHILAHGAPYGASAFGVSLAGTVLTGRQLASTLFDVDRKGVHRPTVVTLATCDSGAQGSVVNAPDVSVAHELHEAGIPLVVASQFPLSTDGSVPLVKTFYSDQLCGDNPLMSLYRVRLDLTAQASSRFHDWASIVVYEALPADLDKQLEHVRYWQTRRKLEHALTTLENAVTDTKWTAERHDCCVRNINTARGDLPDKGTYAAECVGLRAASWKRQAQVDYTLAKKAIAAKKAQDEIREHAQSCYDNLQQALADYRSAANSFLVVDANEPVQRKATLHWLLGQVLSLEAVLGETFDLDSWTVARFSAMAELGTCPSDGVVWGHGTLAELKLLRLTDPSLGPDEVATCKEEVLEHARKLVLQNGLVSEPIFSTGRQLIRYIDWWSQNDFAEMVKPFGVPDKETWREHGLIETIGDVLAIFKFDPEREKRRASKTAKSKKPEPSPGESSPPPPSAPPTPEPQPSPTTLGPRATRSSGAIFDIEMLPAKNGDCLWIEYGDPKAPNRILIDCGAESAAKLLNKRVADLHAVGKMDSFELFVLTHIDADHISGVLPFFKNRGSLTFGQVWFNAEPQLPPAVLGVMQGEKFADILNAEPGLRAAWNKSAGTTKKGPAPIVRPDQGPLPSYTLPGGMTLTVLSPGNAQLKDLATVWRRELQIFKNRNQTLAGKPKPLPVSDPAGFNVEELAESKEKPDPSVANGSSIAVLAEFDGRAVLLTGDAHAEVMGASIKRLLADRGSPGRLRLDAMKLSHHGSTNALTRGLLDLIECPQYLISTDGSKFYHPDREAVARVILYGGKNPKLIFNYRSEMNGLWGEPVLRDKYGYRTDYPGNGEAGGNRVSL